MRGVFSLILAPTSKNVSVGEVGTVGARYVPSFLPLSPFFFFSSLRFRSTRWFVWFAGLERERKREKKERKEKKRKEGEREKKRNG